MKKAKELQRLGVDCYERFRAECGAAELTVAVRTLLTKIQELDGKAD